MLKCTHDSDSSSRRKCGKRATHWLLGKGSSKKPVCQVHAARLQADGQRVKEIPPLEEKQ